MGLCTKFGYDMWKGLWEIGLLPVWRLHRHIWLAVADVSVRSTLLAKWGGLMVSPDIENKLEIYSCEERGVKTHLHYLQRPLEVKGHQGHWVSLWWSHGSIYQVWLWWNWLTSCLASTRSNLIGSSGKMLWIWKIDSMFFVKHGLKIICAKFREDSTTFVIRDTFWRFLT